MAFITELAADAPATDAMKRAAVATGPGNERAATKNPIADKRETQTQTLTQRLTQTQTQTQTRAGMKRAAPSPAMRPFTLGYAVECALLSLLLVAVHGALQLALGQQFQRVNAVRALSRVSLSDVLGAVTSLGASDVLASAGASDLLASHDTLVDTATGDPDVMALLVILRRLATSVWPALTVLVALTHRAKSTGWMQLVLVVLSIGAGYQCLKLMTTSRVFEHMEQVPGLGALWAFTLIELELGYAIVSMLAVFMAQTVTRFMTLVDGSVSVSSPVPRGGM